MYQSTSYVLAVDTKKTLFNGMYINFTNPIFSYRTAKLNGKEIFTVEQIHEKYGLDIDYIKDTIKNCVDKMIRYSKNNR